MRYHITHATQYIYQSPVSHCLNELRLKPRTLAGQELRETAVRVDPQPAFMHERKDYYGNDVVSFEILEKHERMETVAESIVSVQFPPADLPSSSWEEARRWIAAEADDACVAASEFVYPSPYIPALKQLEEYA